MEVELRFIDNNDCIPDIVQKEEAQYEKDLLLSRAEVAERYDQPCRKLDEQIRRYVFARFCEPVFREQALKQLVIGEKRVSWHDPRVTGTDRYLVVVAPELPEVVVALLDQVLE
jgi:hypothetical protein